MERLTNKRFRQFLERFQPIKNGRFLWIDYEEDLDTLFLSYDVANEVVLMNGFSMDLDGVHEMTDKQINELKTFLNNYADAN